VGGYEALRVRSWQSPVRVMTGTCGQLWASGVGEGWESERTREGVRQC